MCFDSSKIKFEKREIDVAPPAARWLLQPIHGSLELVVAIRISWIDIAGGLKGIFVELPLQESVIHIEVFVLEVSGEGEKKSERWK